MRIQEWREPVFTITGPFILGPVLKSKRRRIKPPPAFLLLLSAAAAITGVVFVLLSYRL
jgi:hypothetical protein